MKFNVGDKVRVKNSITVGSSYDGGCFFVDDMEKYKGRVLEVVNIRTTGVNPRYELSEVVGYRVFSDSMLEPAVETPMDKLRTGDVLLTKGGAYKIVYLNTPNGNIYVYPSDMESFGLDDYYNKDLVMRNGSCYSEGDIAKVFRPDNDMSFGKIPTDTCTSFTLVQQLIEDKPTSVKQEKQLTVKEIEKLLGYSVKIVAGE